MDPSGEPRFTPERRQQLEHILLGLLQRDTPPPTSISVEESQLAATIEVVLRCLDRGWPLPDLAGVPQNLANAMMAFAMTVLNPSVPLDTVDLWLEENREALSWDQPPFNPEKGYHTVEDARNRLFVAIDQVPPEQLDEALTGIEQILDQQESESE